MPATKTKKSKKVRFPKRELNTWLKTNKSWDHMAWEGLLGELAQQGFEAWTDNQEGRDQIGLYIESNRKV